MKSAEAAPDEELEESETQNTHTRSITSQRDDISRPSGKQGTSFSSHPSEEEPQEEPEEEPEEEPVDDEEAEEDDEEAEEESEDDDQEEAEAREVRWREKTPH